MFNNRKVVGNVNAITLTFKWEINNLCISSMNVGDVLESPRFSADNVTSNIRWCLSLIRSRKSEDQKDYLALCLKANPSDVKAVVNLKILNDDDEVLVNETFEKFVVGTHLYGRREMISCDLIVSSAKTTFVCEITYSENEVKYKKVTNREDEEQEEDILSRLELIDRYEALLNDSNFSDISLISEGKAVKVNKHILAKSSPVFAAMFDAEMQEKQGNTVVIADVKYDVLLEMIRFVYAGKVNNIDTLACELATAADKYQLDSLKNKCDKAMRNNLTLDNVIDCLLLADKLRMDNLKEKAIEFIVANASDISDKPDFDLLPACIMSKVFRCMAKKRKL